MSSSEPTTVNWGLWIDFDQDGEFDAFYQGSIVSNLGRVSGADQIEVDVPGDYGGLDIFFRLRAFDSGTTPTADDFTGTFLIGHPVTAISF